MRDVELESVDVIKYLSVHVDYSLSWKDHLKSVSSKVSRGIGMLKKAEYYIPGDCLKIPYSSIVEPCFRYCCSIWRTCGVTEKNRLQKFQNRAARSVTSSTFDASSRLLRERLRWKTIDELIVEDSKSIVYKSHG